MHAAQEHARIRELLDHYSQIDVDVLYDIARQSAVYLEALLHEYRQAASTEVEQEYWHQRAVIVHSRRQRLPADNRFVLLAHMDAWRSEVIALKAALDANGESA